MFGHQRRQRGSGLLPFQGMRYQRGNGFFGNLMKQTLFPLLRYVGIKGLGKFTEFAQEAVNNPDEVKNIAKRKLLDMAGDAIEDGGKRAKKFMQTGKGIPLPIKATTLKPISKLPKAKANKGKQQTVKKPRGRSKFVYDLEQ